MQQARSVMIAASVLGVAVSSVVAEVRDRGTVIRLAAGDYHPQEQGSAPGSSLEEVERSALLLTWDATACPAPAVNVYSGAIGNYATFTAGTCDLPATGSATISPAGSAWFLVVATDGSATDGSWSRDAGGSELTYASASTVCTATTMHEPAGNCP